MSKILRKIYVREIYSENPIFKLVTTQLLGLGNMLDTGETTKKNWKIGKKVKLILPRISDKKEIYIIAEVAADRIVLEHLISYKPLLVKIATKILFNAAKKKN